MTPFLVTKTIVQEATNQTGPMLCLMSVVPHPDPDGKVTSIDLVIGASYVHRCASAFSKRGVLELAALLAEIGAAMVDPR
jgi:hypothetical protein